MSASDPGFLAALREAQASADEGGMPVGGAIVSSSGEILGTGRNQFVQKGSVILHVSFLLVLFSVLGALYILVFETFQTRELSSAIDHIFPFPWKLLLALSYALMTHSLFRHAGRNVGL
jgi:hypothetical protein